MNERIDFQTEPGRWRHWRVEIDGPVATLWMDVDEAGGLFDGYELKLNSYDLGVDIELADAVTRMRFEHPEVRTVVLRSAKDGVFCAGANIRMLAGAEHAHKVNFCKFTNETRNMFEAAAEESGQTYIAAIKGSCAGGGYELALACNHIMLTDDGTSNVALPEVPLLAVLPGTGGLTRVTDKRRVRRDIADVFCAMEEGARGPKALQWKLVDEVVPNARFDEVVAQRAREFAERAGKVEAEGIALPPLTREITPERVSYSTVSADLDRAAGIVTITIRGPEGPPPASIEDLHAQGAETWALRLARELDDLILHLRFNELEMGVWVFRSEGDPGAVAAHEAHLLAHQGDDWLAREILLLWKRVLKRIDLTSRSLVALIEPGSCFAGMLAEILFAVDRSFMAEGEFEGQEDKGEAQILLTEGNFGPYPMSNALTRLETRFLGTPEAVEAARAHMGQPLTAEDADALGLVTHAYDDIDWEDEVRIFLEERASFSPDALTGMEANLRFAGPETMETRIFGRLTAWQNWIFQRPNAVGEDGALRRYGTGLRADYDRRRV
ncbi:MAG TPA: benzoyl-CoA-dihydrodiol lyase [Aliiroseovarius sp.]|nr:benzoyl-CoA-dihydrodiol lyase [Aliiroseovarius sp.]